MDPFDEFEFKPLTDGLGFHKKTSSLKDAAQKTSLVADELNRAVPEPPPHSLMGEASPMKAKSVDVYEDFLKALEKPAVKTDGRTFRTGKEKPMESRPTLGVEITEPLPRTKKETSAPLIDQEPSPFKNPIYPPASPSIGKVPLKGGLGDKSFIEESTGVRRGAADSPMGGLEKAPVCVRSAILDLVFVIALSMVFLISLLLVTKVSLSNVVANAQVDRTTQLSMLLLFVAVMQIYVVVARSFFGRTLGEWTFDHQMGSIEQQASPFYPLKVAWRSIIITLTGVVVLPALSFIIRRDVAAFLTGLQLYRQRNS
jgi:hypothetical protein